MVSNPPNLFDPLELPCGVVLKNRILKSAMSDSLGDGRGTPTAAQMHLYRLWAEGGAAAAIIGEVQGSPCFAEKPGNLVLNAASDKAAFSALAEAGGQNGAQLWLQLGHAGAMAHPPISPLPKGPSALNLPGLTCEALSPAEIAAIPDAFAQTARLGQELGFGGVQIHAAHGFLLSQFLSPLFNRRVDAYGGAIHGRMRLVLETIEAVRGAVGPSFPVALKLNSSDLLDGGLEADDALAVVAALDRSKIDLIDISGGTYFPGARSSSDSGGGGPYFLAFAERARDQTDIPLMATGGFKTRCQAQDALKSGAIDLVGLARALVLDPTLPNRWQSGDGGDPVFPRFAEVPEGGMTAWYTMRLTDLAEGRPPDETSTPETALAFYNARDAERAETWNATFFPES